MTRKNVVHSDESLRVTVHQQGTAAAATSNDVVVAMYFSIPTMLSNAQTLLRPNLVGGFALGECLWVAYDLNEVFNSDAREFDEAVVDKELNLADYVEMWRRKRS
ncbi:Hypothetical predicted protein [Olea europaea subsp. europaea]|uniref:Uncharacterized protein n=1 Tax=Olea europaea subsp. europaea TaxID=158383 RepID=A0A8S0UIG7_OLEEU|nr:Hypothetical predicted protein [Olea europaea subsp. europaea]